MCGRWTRLERYARWKSGRFPLDKLPPEIINSLCENYLDSDDTTNLLHALLGFLPDIHNFRHMKSIPSEMRVSWMLRKCIRDFKTHLWTLGGSFSVKALHCQSIVVFADWSPFAPKGVGAMVCKVEWIEDGCTLHIDEEGVHKCFNHSIQRGRPAVHLAIYECYLSAQGTSTLLYPRPIALTSYPLLPHYIVE